MLYANRGSFELSSTGPTADIPNFSVNSLIMKNVDLLYKNLLDCILFYKIKKQPKGNVIGIITTILCQWYTSNLLYSLVGRK